MRYEGYHGEMSRELSEAMGSRGCSGKECYVAPELVRYGDVTKLTAVKSAAAFDGQFTHNLSIRR